MLETGAYSHGIRFTARCHFANDSRTHPRLRIKQLRKRIDRNADSPLPRSSTTGGAGAACAHAWTLAHAPNGLAARTPRAVQTDPRLLRAGVFFGPRSDATRYGETDARSDETPARTSTGDEARRTKEAACRNRKAWKVKTVSRLARCTGFALLRSAGLTPCPRGPSAALPAGLRGFAPCRRSGEPTCPGTDRAASSAARKAKTCSPQGIPRGCLRFASTSPGFARSLFFRAPIKGRACGAHARPVLATLGCGLRVSLDGSAPGANWPRPRWGAPLDRPILSFTVTVTLNIIR